MENKHIWVCEDCLSENLEKRQYIDRETGETEDYCNDCESFTHKINRGMINLYDENEMGDTSTTSHNYN